MKTSGINGLNELVALVRASRRATVSKSTGNRNQSSDVPPSIESQPLEERLAAALEGVELGTDDGRRDAGRVLVGEILSWEFGAGIRSHAEFRTMVEAIEASLAREPRLAARIGALLEELCDRPRKGR